MGSSSTKALDRRESVKCKAYEANRSKPSTPSETAEAGKNANIGVYFAVWWALNVVFNIYNKKVLNMYSYPWLTSTLSLTCGSLMMLISWATGIAEAPKTDLDFWKTLFPVNWIWVLFGWWENMRKYDLLMFMGLFGWWQNLRKYDLLMFLGFVLFLYVFTVLGVSA